MRLTPRKENPPNGVSSRDSGRERESAKEAPEKQRLGRKKKDCDVLGNRPPVPPPPELRLRPRVHVGEAASALPGRRKGLDVDIEELGEKSGASFLFLHLG